MIFPINFKVNPTLSIDLLVIYAFISGTVSYLNYFDNLEEIKKIAETHCLRQTSSQRVILVLSFRYAQIIDSEALEEMSYLVEELKNMSVPIIFTGLHIKLVEQMKGGRYFSELLDK